MIGLNVKSQKQADSDRLKSLNIVYRDRGSLCRFLSHFP